jgi:hypothetical protein
MKRVSAPMTRKQILYRRSVASCDVREDPSFIYHSSLCPGNDFFRLLCHGPAELCSKALTANQRLRMWIPDTIVYLQGHDHHGDLIVQPVWYYSRRDGTVECTTRFGEEALLAKLGNRSRPGAGVAFVKRAKTTRARASATKDALMYLGNNLRLINTHELASFHGTREERAAASAGPGGTAGAQGATLAVQRFIKCSSDQASVTRCTWERDRRTVAHIITNRASYYDGVGPNSPERKAGSVGGGGGGGGESRGGGVSISGKRRGPSACQRLCTQLQKEFAVTVQKISGSAVRELDAAMQRLVHFVQGVHRLNLQQLVADFVLDADRTLWLLEVKAFRLVGSDPSRPLLPSLSVPILQRGIGSTPGAARGRARSQALNLAASRVRVLAPAGAPRPETVQESDAAKARQPTLKSAATRAKARASAAKERALARARAAAAGEAGQLTRRCGFCGRRMLTSKLPFRLTRQMIDRAKRHIVKRNERALVDLPWLLPGFGRASIHKQCDAAKGGHELAQGSVAPLSSGPERVRGSGGGALSGLAGRAATADHGDASAALSGNHIMEAEYRAWPVCAACHSMHKLETAVSRLEGLHATLSGALRLGATKGAREQAVGRWSADSGVGALGAAATSSGSGSIAGAAKAADVTAAADRPELWIPVTRSDRLPNLTLCRFMVAVHGILHPPPVFFAHAAALRARFGTGSGAVPRWLLPRLECTFLGATTSISVDVLPLVDSPDAAIGKVSRVRLGRRFCAFAYLCLYACLPVVLIVVSSHLHCWGFARAQKYLARYLR